MGLFYTRRTTNKYLVLTIRPAVYLGVIILAAATIISGFIGYEQTNFWLGAVVLAAAIWYTAETWPVIKANYAGETRTEGKGIFSFEHPTEYWIKR